MPPKPAARPFEVHLDPVDNQRLARLCGALDANLRQIESALDVAIARRGARFSVRGEPEQAQRRVRRSRPLGSHFYAGEEADRECRRPARGPLLAQPP
ncbi:MAG: hypothetical protein ACREUO_08645 [Burkholderiales bacterium]